MKANKTVQRSSWVPPLLASLVSLVIPGLGQALAGFARRGLVLFASLASIAALLAWRIHLTARREITWPAKVTKAFDLEPILLAIAIGLILLYLWIAVDAYFSARRVKNASAFWIFMLVLLLFFGLGWEIGEINLVTLTTEIGDAGPFMERILWPWDRAIKRDEEIQMRVALVQIPCSDTPVAEQNIDTEPPTLTTDPTCGNLSEATGEPGTILHAVGKGFASDRIVEIYWRDNMGNEFRQRQEGEYLQVMPDEKGNFELDVIMPYRLIPPTSAVDIAVWQLQGRQLAGVGPAHPSTELLIAIERMIETIFLGMMATFFGILFSFPLSFLAARNLMSGSWVTLAIYYLVRTVLNIIRSIEPLIWAVIAIVVVGLGPFAGIVALTVHTIASLAKLYSEAIESIDAGPIEAIQATGANWLQTIMFAVVPQIVPPFVSFTIYRWDINVRMSTVIGLVGGGGIGFILIQWIRLLDYKAAGIAVWFIAVTVAILDYVSAEIRERFV
jgi:phosphonate transport system permease protein